MPSRRKLLAVFSLLSLTGACPAVARIGTAADARVTVLQGGRIIDGSGAAPIENGNLVVKGGRIEAVQGPGSKPPDDAQIVDVRGKTLMPALIAGHAHLGLTNGTSAGAGNMTEANVIRQLQKYMRHGIGTVAVFGTDHDFIYTLRAAQRKGKLALPTILTAGHGFGVRDGMPPVAMGMDEVYRPTSVAQVREDVARLAAHKVDLIKIWVDDGGDGRTQKMDPALYGEVIRQAHRHGIKVAAHVFYLEDAKRLARDGVDIFGHSVRDQPVDEELIALMKKNGVACIPTLDLDEAFFVYADRPDWMQQPFFRQSLDPGVWEWLRSPAYKVKEQARKDFAMAQANARALHQAGIRVGLGTDSGATIARVQGFAEHRELELMVEAGLTPAQALDIATARSAALLGLADRGSVRDGLRADLVVLEADPVADIRNTRRIARVYQAGREVAGSIV
jgi:imidazolonepropionase-like amidohydrolase